MNDVPSGAIRVTTRLPRNRCVMLSESDSELIVPLPVTGRTDVMPVALLSGIALGTSVEANAPLIQPGTVTLQVGSPGWTGTLTASQAAFTVSNSVQLSGNRFLAACNVQVLYVKYELAVVFISIALYMIWIAVCTPRPTTVEPLQVGLVGCPLVGLEPSATR